MTINEGKIGTRVRTQVAFSCVPQFTEGIIDQDYISGVMVAWDLPDQPLPPGYRVYDGKPAFVSGILRDGFDKETELDFLEVVK